MAPSVTDHKARARVRVTTDDGRTLDLRGDCPDPEHVFDVTQRGWRMLHPEACETVDCPFDAATRARKVPVGPTGVYAFFDPAEISGDWRDWWEVWL